MFKSYFRRYAIRDGKVYEGHLSTVLNLEAANRALAVHLEAIAIDPHPRDAADGNCGRESDVGRELNLSAVYKRSVESSFVRHSRCLLKRGNQSMGGYLSGQR